MTAHAGYPQWAEEEEVLLCWQTQNGEQSELELKWVHAAGLRNK